MAASLVPFDHSDQDSGRLQVMVDFLRAPGALQPNDCSRLHQIVDAVKDGGVYVLGGDDDFDAAGVSLLLTAPVFLLKHDWVSLLGSGLEADKIGNDFRIPYPITAFEFMVSGTPVTLLAYELDESGKLGMTPVIKWQGSWYFTQFDPSVAENLTVLEQCWDQVRAACVALDLGLAVYDDTPAPDRLNAKRKRSGKPPLPVLHVINLAGKHKQAAGSAEGSTKRRLHFRRGHWRHYDDGTKTWVKWTLVGDASLGFVEHRYSL